MADETVEDFLNSRKRRPARKGAAAVAAAAEPSYQPPLLQMKKYVVPVKSGNESTNSQDHS